MSRPWASSARGGSGIQAGAAFPGAELCDACSAGGNLGVLGEDMLREGEVVFRIFMRAANEGLSGEGREALEVYAAQRSEFTLTGERERLSDTWRSGDALERWIAALRALGADE